MAINGGRILFAETTFKASKEKTKTNARAIPIAKLIPNPPRFFCEDSDSARIVNTMIENGIDVLK